ncbi:anthranilate synthase component I family protein [Roseivirga sp.]|uniref:anthranilate synthase component I family protein n=1 Tax=Roseivirga sp. TaxID=1964215 RepID=UPI003B8C38C3
MEANLIIDKTELKLENALHWANEYEYFSFLNGNNIAYPHGGFPTVLAIGAKRIFTSRKTNTFDELFEFHKANPSWLFGFLGYDLKNELEQLSSIKPARISFPEACFFEPLHLIYFHSDKVEIVSDHPKSVFESILNRMAIKKESHFGQSIASTSKQEYLDTVEKLRNHIEVGDIYEINYCQEHYGEILSADPVEAYLKLNSISPKPFSAFQKYANQYLLCASPERFIKKSYNTIVSQPIKGTIKRGKTAQEDQQLKHQLRNDEKELAENMMIVDLVRNDLSRTSTIGSVKVEEIFGIYSFEQVHQMISTISSQKHPDKTWMEVIQNAFPMGSMTGAPKIKVMELIDKYENVRRGMFSGAAGFISPSGDFDFNVIIRSLFLDLKNMLYSFQVGGAITYDSIPEKEYEECMIKASAIMQLLETMNVSTSEITH